jgi:SAM-dependent methyltransferase
MPVTRTIDHTRAHYETKALAYAEATRNRSPGPALQLFAKRLPVGARILDLGCGAGHDMKSFVKLGFRPIGLDYAAPLAELAQVTSGAPTVVGDVRSLPFGNEVFDGVWASASLLHLPRGSLGAALLETRRVLRGLGLFFASVKAGRGDLEDSEGRFFALYEPESWKRSLKAASFVPIAVTSNEEHRRNGIKPTIVHWINSLAVRSAESEVRYD